ncbi:hypothetical protein ACSBL2_18675 [Pedobacter sp. AW31-3R]|uniref:hypothetical protein n=1 Tax=Pedobacter sp. AW31-3R TaxID=3445781 RepID=UPI003F9F9B3E
MNNIKAIDDYLFGRLAPDDALLFQAKVLLNSDLMEDVQYQQETYAMIRKYSRQQIRAEIMAVQDTLTTQPQYQGFMQRMANFFKKH